MQEGTNVGLAGFARIQIKEKVKSLFLSHKEKLETLEF